MEDAQSKAPEAPTGVANQLKMAALARAQRSRQRQQEPNEAVQAAEVKDKPVEKVDEEAQRRKSEMMQFVQGYEEWSNSITSSDMKKYLAWFEKNIAQKDEEKVDVTEVKTEQKEEVQQRTRRPYVRKGYNLGTKQIETPKDTDSELKAKSVSAASDEKEL